MLMIRNVVLFCLFTVLFLGLVGCDSSGGGSDEWCPDIGTEGMKQNMVEFINQARAEARTCGDEHYPAAPPVAWDDLLADAAMAHSTDMAENDFFSHTGSDGGSVSDRIVAAGYDYATYGENIYLGVNSSEEAVDGWLESPGHCANIMNPDVTEVGAAAALGEDGDCGTLYWTLVLARPETIVAFSR